jgi:hypothetical protein
VGGLADQDLAGAGGLLQPRRHVDGLAGGEGRVGLVDDDLAGLDADARLDPDVVGVIEMPSAARTRARRRPRAPPGCRTPP